MSFPAGFTFTAKGRRLRDKAETGVQLVFVEMQLGDGVYSGPSDSLTALLSPKITLNVTVKKLVPGEGSLLAADLPMSSISAGFYWREWGIFAQDPDEGKILYAYVNAGSSAEWIETEGTSDLRERNLGAFVNTGNATDVTSVFGSSILYATQDDLRDLAGHGRTTETIKGAYDIAAAARGKTKAFTLPAAGWTASGGTYTQAATMAGLSDDYILSWSWATSADGEACVAAEIMLDASCDSAGLATLTWTAKALPAGAIRVFVVAELPVTVE